MWNHQTGECYITPQNHGYHINTATFRPGWQTLFTTPATKSNEGIAHTTRPYFASLFHPEASCGPTDTELMFDTCLEACSNPCHPFNSQAQTGAAATPCQESIAAGIWTSVHWTSWELDYSGGQAIKLCGWFWLSESYFYML